MKGFLTINGIKITVLDAELFTSDKKDFVNFIYFKTYEDINIEGLIYLASQTDQYGKLTSWATPLRIVE